MAGSCCATDASGALVIIISFCVSVQILCASNIIPITPDTFHSFISTTNVRLLHVSHQVPATRKIEFFLSHYRKAAVQLEPYGILLGQVSCNDYPEFEYCKRERTERLLFGFRGTRERLVLPISTLADENAIVASALHLALINSVPIIQTTSELNALEEKCHGKCNIVLAYHNTLGTYEHNLFLKVAWAYQQQHVFALTTSLHASPGAPSSLYTASSRASAPHKQLVALWILQCKNIRSNQLNCDASLFRNNFKYKDINKFIKALELPKWIEVKDNYPSTYEKFGIHQVLLIYDEASKKRVFSLAEPLGLAFRGSVGVLTCSLATVSIPPLQQYSTLISAPAIVFLPALEKCSSKMVCEPIILNELENAYDFIMDQLKHEEMSEMSKENYEYENSKQALSKQVLPSAIQNDSEISTQRFLETIKYLEPGRERRLKQMCPKSSQYKIILYYLDWDTVSEKMLQIFETLDVAHLGVGELISISCLAHSDECKDVNIFPTMEIVGPYKSQRFGAMSFKRLTQELFLFVSPSYKIIWNKNSLYEELQNGNYFFIDDVGLVAATDYEESTHLLVTLNMLPQKPFLIIGIKEAASVIGLELNCSIPCMGLLKLGSRIKHASVYRNDLNDIRKLNEFLEYSKYPFVPELTPDLLPKVRHQLLVVALGTHPWYYLQNIVKLTHCQDFCHFSRISRNSPWFEDLRRIHAPTETSALIAMNLTSACSYTYDGQHDDGHTIAIWLENIINLNVSPTVVFHQKDWKPLQPAVDYLKLLEDERHKLDQSIIMDNEEPFIFPDGIGLSESNNIF